MIGMYVVLLGGIVALAMYILSRSKGQGREFCERCGEVTSWKVVDVREHDGLGGRVDVRWECVECGRVEVQELY